MPVKSASATAPHSGHRVRLRERLQREPLAVADYEVLELLLGYGLTRKDTKPLAKELLRRFGSIRGALDARPDELQQVPGFGPGLMALWRLMREVLARHAASPVRQRQELATPEAVARMARSRLANSPVEECWVALLDGRNKLLAWERVQRGDLNTVSFKPRDVLAMALAHKARGIILAHNHPGGNAGPSQIDIAKTRELYTLAQSMELCLLDHVIVTQGDCYSILNCKKIVLDAVEENIHG